MKHSLFALLTLVLPLTVTAQDNKEPRIISRSRAVFSNTDCAATNTCDLKEVRYIAEGYEILVNGGYHYGTRFLGHYVTNTVPALENYAFVQFIKGCQYYSSDDGKLNVSYLARDHFSKRIIFCHKDWVIDSLDTDPAYYSTPSSRHFNYKWSTTRGSVSENPQKYYGFEKPVYPELYVTDRPGTAFFMNGNSKNISLSFKTCLYRTADIPKETTPENINFGKPISCFYWDSSWIYNSASGKFQSPYYIVKTCGN